VNRDGLLGSFWPSDDEELLLRTALSTGDDTRRAWAELRPRFDYEHTDKEQQRLLPLVYRRLRDLGVDDPDLARMKGLYRRAWYQNQFRLREAATVAGLLAGAGIEVLALKGVALVTQWYDELGVRPMGDIDLLVPTARREAALAVLQSHGWTPRPHALRLALDHRHGVGLFHPTEGALDLHWQVAMALVLRGDEQGSCDDFWATSVPLDLGGTVVRAPAAPDLLLNVMAHGCRWKSGAYLHWVADAVTLLRAAGDRFDWGRLVDQAEKRRVVLMVRDGLRYLTRLDVPVPDQVRQRLDHVPVGPRDRVVHRARTRRPRRWPLLGALPATINVHVQLTGHQRAPRAVIGYPVHALRMRAAARGRQP
jgi:Uncharacterised nucleotidyltransferase